jgi:glutathione S-transferase
MRLYTFAVSPNCQKVLAVARELDIRLDRVNVDIFRGEAKTPAYLAKNPNGRVPLLEDDGFALSESNASLAYLAGRKASPSLLPVEPRERAEVDYRLPTLRSARSSAPRRRAGSTSRPTRTSASGASG